MGPPLLQGGSKGLGSEFAQRGQVVLEGRCHDRGQRRVAACFHLANARAASESGRRQLHQQDGQGTVR